MSCASEIFVRVTISVSWLDLKPASLYVKVDSKVVTLMTFWRSSGR